MNGLSLTVFGGLTAALNDQPLPRLPTVRAQGLLIFLAVENALGSAVQRRETLMELLWPGMPPQSSRKNLRTTLYYLRQAIDDYLPDDAAEKQAIPFLLSDRNTVQISKRSLNPIQITGRGGRGQFVRTGLNIPE